jgi:hypothetical protein
MELGLPDSLDFFSPQPPVLGIRLSPKDLLHTNEKFEKITKKAWLLWLRKVSSKIIPIRPGPWPVSPLPRAISRKGNVV